MLMALLPLAGWAADLSKGTLIAPSPYLGKAVTGIKVYNEANVLLVEHVDYEFDGYFSDEACTTSVTVADIQAADAETAFWARVSGINGYEGSKKASFVVKKMPLRVVGTAGTKVYGTAEDGPIFSEVTSVVEDYWDTTDPEHPVFLGGDVVEDFAAGANLSFAREEGDDKGEYAISATITDAELAKNYIVYSASIVEQGAAIPETDPVEYEYDQAFYKITAKPFTTEEEATISIVVKGTYIYNGAAQMAEVEVKDIALNRTLVEGEDYEIVAGEGENIDNKNASAGEVKGGVVVTGMGNYEETPNNVDFIINKAPMLLSPKVTRQYDGTKTLVDLPVYGDLTEDVNFTYQGFVGGEGVADLGLSYSLDNVKWAVTGTPALSKNVGTYTLVFQDKAGDHPMNFLSPNYEIIPSEGTFEITPLDNNTIKVNTLAQTVETGANIDQTRYTIIEGVLAPGVGETAEATNAAELAEVQALIEIVEDPENEGKLIAQWKAATATNKAPLNYGEILTVEAGDLTRVNASVVIGLKEDAWAEQLTKEYDGQPISFEVTDKSKLIIIPASAASAVTVTNLVANSPEDNPNAGAKEITLSGATAEGYDIVYIASNGLITPKPVTVTIPEQGIQQGAEVEGNFETDNFTIEGLVEGENKDDIFALAINGDVTAIVEDVLRIKDDAVDGDWINLAAKADEDVEDDFDPAIAAANYELDVVIGRLVITPADAIVLDGATFDITTILEQAGANEDVTVTFADRALQANVWSSMVLPFETSVLELSNALGYCVVDMLVESGSDMNFKLHMGDIPAYTPFLIKTGVDKNMDAAVLKHKQIVEPTEENLANLIVSNDDYNFIGKVDNDAIATDFWAVGSKMTADDFIFNKYRAGTTLKALRAYITAKTAAAAARLRIFVEEEDGTISEFNADEAATSIDGLDTEIVETEGWYTIGGQKLEGAPSQKGIYIKNGKKIVVK